MEPIEVVVRFTPEGKAYPLKFTWKGSTFMVESTGRRWTDSDGQHILVLSLDGRVFELFFNLVESRWYLNSSPRGGKIALST